MEIFDDAGVKDPNVRKFLKKILDSFRPRVNFGAKQKVELQIFVLKGHPTHPPVWNPYLALVNVTFDPEQWLALTQTIPGMWIIAQTSVLNRSQNSESIIREVFDLIIDFKSIFKPDFSRFLIRNSRGITWLIEIQIFHKIVVLHRNHLR